MYLRVHPFFIFKKESYVGKNEQNDNFYVTIKKKNLKKRQRFIKENREDFEQKSPENQRFYPFLH
jgi:hypothetical protein